MNSSSPLLKFKFKTAKFMPPVLKPKVSVASFMMQEEEHEEATATYDEQSDILQSRSSRHRQRSKDSNAFSPSQLHGLISSREDSQEQETFFSVQSREEKETLQDLLQSVRMSVPSQEAGSVEMSRDTQETNDYLNFKPIKVPAKQQESKSLFTMASPLRTSKCLAAAEIRTFEPVIQQRQQPPSSAVAA